MCSRRCLVCFAGWLAGVAGAFAAAPPPRAAPSPQEVLVALLQVARLEAEARALENRGRHARAEPLLHEVLNVRRKVFGERHAHTATSYNNLAVNLNEQGRFAQAEPLFRKAVELTRTLHGEAHEDSVAALDNLACNLGSQGRFAQAEPLHRRALALLVAARGPAHPACAKYYNNLARNLAAQDKFAEAEKQDRRALELFRKARGEDHLLTAIGYNNLAQALIEQGRHADALPLLEKALAICRKVRGEDSVDTADVCYNLAALLRAQGRFDRARPLAEQALRIHREALGEDHPEAVRSYIGLALNLHAQGQPARAEEMARRAAAGFERSRLRVSFTGLGRAAFAGRESPLPLLSALQARNGKPRQAWDSLEDWLARALLDEQAARRRLLSPAQRELQEKLLAELHDLEARLGALRKAPGEPARKDAERLRAARDRALRELSELNAELSERHGLAAGRPYDLAAIQKQLPEDATLVAWTDVLTAPWACVVRPRGDPVWVPLSGSGVGGAWAPDDTALAPRLRGQLPRRGASWRELAARLYAQRLGPLAGPLRGVRHLVVLPSPALAGVPLEVLIEARPAGHPRLIVSYAPSGSIFGRLREQAARARPAGAPRLLALGDPDFAATPAGTAGVALARGAGFAPLPGTRREVTSLARLFGKADLLLGREASEVRLGELARGDRLRDYRYLHLATHGIADARQPLRSFLALADRHLPDALQSALRGEPVLTGRLTAEQILNDWRLDADLVVLSACQSGLGKYEGGEGYVGFAQPLFLAGARSLVLSQWSVDDEATALLMVRFYQNLLGRREGLKKPLPKAEALAEAKDWLRNLSDKEARRVAGSLPRGSAKVPATAPGRPRPYAHPYYWAGFILVGDPG
jgi:CHAT domain-containing protein/tetratricopeptide (TPR) repeat protein